MITKLDFGTIFGPHVKRDGERPARLCTLCTRTNRHAYCPRPGKMGYHYLLGVKWSQVQILSARQKKGRLAWPYAFLLIAQVFDDT
jgi:hypothetical protein